MKPAAVTISILVLDESTMLTVASVIDPLRAANRLSSQSPFHWRLHAATGDTVRLTGGVTMAADAAFNDSCQGDVLIIVASFNQHTNASLATVQLLSRVASRYKVVVGIEAGTWLLARSGLVTTHRVTTHWEDFENLANRFPSLRVVHDRFVIDGKYWTCGGANPALDMMLELISHYHGKHISLQVASVFIYDQSHNAADPQMVHSVGVLAQREPRIAHAVQMMESAIETPLSIHAICNELSVSSRTLEQLFKRYLDKSPSAYYLQLRLTAARKMVTDTHFSMQQVSVLTGFNSQSSLTRAFKKRYGISPGKMRTNR